MEDRIFQKTLSDMSFDFAARGAIRHLHGLGFGPEEIRDRLSSPLPIERIREELALIEKEEREGTERLNTNGSPMLTAAAPSAVW